MTPSTRTWPTDSELEQDLTNGQAIVERLEARYGQQMQVTESSESQQCPPHKNKESEKVASRNPCSKHKITGSGQEISLLTA